MKKNKTTTLLFAAFLLCGIAALSSCDYFRKKQPETTTADTLSTGTNTAANIINVPHADTSLIPVLSEILDEAFAASARKDYATFATYLLYRGPDSTRFGVDVFSVKNNYEKSVVRITSNTFNKWNRNITSREYGRVFELPQPAGTPMVVLEVLFIGDKKLDRKFFGFMPVGTQFKITDVTNYL